MTPQLQELIKTLSKENVMTNEAELTAIVKWLYASEPKNGEVAIELGSFQGKTARVMGAALEAIGVDCKVISVDCFLYCAGCRVKWQMLNGPYASRNELVVADTRDFMPKYCGSTVAFIFVDAGHEYEEAKADVLNSMDKLRVGGVLFIDDYDEKAYPGVFKAVNETLLSNEQYELVDNPGYYIVFRKVK